MDSVEVKLLGKEALVVIEAIDYMDLDLSTNADLCFPDWSEIRIKHTQKLLASARNKIQEAIDNLRKG